MTERIYTIREKKGNVASIYLRTSNLIKRNEICRADFGTDNSFAALEQCVCSQDYCALMQWNCQSALGRGRGGAATAACEGHQLGTFFHITLLLKRITINTDILTKTRKSCWFGCSLFLVAKGVGKQPSLEIKLPSWQRWFRFPVICSALPFLLTPL